MSVVMTVACRSYSALAFDGCPACVDAALDAVTQAGMYVLGQAAPSVTGRTPNPEPIEVSYRLTVRLCDPAGRPMGQDELEASHTLSAVPEEGSWTYESADEPDDGNQSQPGSMRLEDFQTVLDLVQLTPAGFGGITGAIRGQLYGFERPIGEFEVEVRPNR
jgi:hypothetical protein